MPRWQRWFVLGAISAALCGCGGDDSKPAAPAAGGGPQAGGAAGQGPPAGLAPAGMAGGPNDVGRAGAQGAAPASGQPAAALPPAPANSASMQELFQYIPENLTIAIGANFAVLSDKSHVVGSQLLGQFQPATATLVRAGIKSDQIDRIWGGNNRDTGDLVLCVRTKGNIDAAGMAKALSAASESEKIGKGSVYRLPDHSVHKNAIAFVDSKTLLIGRYDTVAAALRTPRAGPVRFGLDALNTPDAHFWIAGDDSFAHLWLSGPGVNAIESLFADSIQTKGVAIGFGGTAPLTAEQIAAVAVTSPGQGRRRNSDEEEEPPSDDGGFAAFARRRGAGGRGNAAGRGTAGGRARGEIGTIAPGTKTVDLAVGMSLATEGMASGIESKLNASSPPAAAGGRGNAGPARGAPGAASAPTHTVVSLDGLLGVQVKSQRVKENIRLAVTLPVSGVPFVTRFIDGVATGTGSGAVADGVFDGTLTTLGAGLAQWPNAKPGALKGVRRVGDLRVTAAYSFLTELLPFVDASELHTRFDYRKSWSDKDNRPHAMAVIPAFLNPADPRMRWEGLSEDMNGLGLTHFVGMSGIEDRRNMIAAELPRSDPRAGIFGYDEVAKFSDITDGTSHTIMMIGSGKLAAPWVQGGGATIRGARAPHFDEFTGFGSKGLPRPGAYVLYADGSARAISATIDPKVFEAMCTIHGAEQIDMSKLVTQGQE